MAYRVTDWTKAPPLWDKLGPKMVLEIRGVARSPHGITNLADPAEPSKVSCADGTCRNSITRSRCALHPDYSYRFQD